MLRKLQSIQLQNSIRSQGLLTMASIGLPCCRPPPSHAFHFGARVCAAENAVLPSFSCAVLESLSTRSANSTSSKLLWDSSVRNSCLSHAPYALCAVTRRAYRTERLSEHRSNTSTAVRGAYNQYGQQGGRNEFPRPPTIQWEKDLVNAVHLIGHVGRDVDIRYLDSGKVVARTSIAVRKSREKNDDPSWFEMEFWDSLAEIAAHHVKKGEQVFVTGRIVVDKWVKDEVQHTLAKVVVRDLCYIEPYRSTNVAEQEQYPDMGSNNQPREVATASSSQQNWSQQVAKQTPQGTGGQRGSSKNNDEAALATEKRWQEFFADPTQWWDNRTKKKNPKGPDFKHKSTQEALWIDSWNNPPWVQKQLLVLEEKQAHHTGEIRDSQERSNTKKLSSFQDSDFLY